MANRNIFIGGAWPYANYYLHIGHLASLLPGDVLARYFRGNGDNVIYVSGSDCHGTPITERARKEGKTPEEIATFYHHEFEKTFKNLEFEYDMYSATMTPEHKEYVQEQFKKMIDNGYVFEKEVAQDYCEHCGQFLSDRQIVGKCPLCGGESTGDQCENCGASLDSSEVLNKKCKMCGNPTILKNNKHLFFKLTAFKNELQKLIEENKSTWRNNAIGEAQKYIDMGLVDRTATRQLDWGVPVPVRGYEDKRIYVWIEAVLGYLSVGKRVAESRGINFDEFMNKDNPNLKSYYVHGKDNIPFHTTIYPALVMSLKNNYQLPKYIVSSAYVNFNNAKMSKSKGNFVTANEFLEKFEADTLRFYFIFKGPETSDKNCDVDDIIQTHNKFLVGQIGNFVNRNLSFINKKFDGVIKEAKIDEEIYQKTVEAYKEIGEFFEKGEMKNASIHIMDYVNLANRYYDAEQPWVKVKENIDEFNNITYTCAFMIANIANLIAPILPKGSQKIKSFLNLQDFKWQVEEIKGDLKIQNLEILYQRLDEKNFEEKN